MTQAREFIVLQFLMSPQMGKQGKSVKSPRQENQGAHTSQVPFSKVHSGTANKAFHILSGTFECMHTYCQVPVPKISPPHARPLPQLLGMTLSRWGGKRLHPIIRAKGQLPIQVSSQLKSIWFFPEFRLAQGEAFKHHRDPPRENKKCSTAYFIALI